MIALAIAMLATFFATIGAQPASAATTCGPYGHWTGVTAYSYKPGAWCASPSKVNYSTRVIFQGDGNLVVYNDNSPVWWSGTVNEGATSMAFQADGNLVIFAGNAVLWNSRTGGHARVASNDYYLRIGNYISCNGSGDQYVKANILLNSKQIWSSYC